MSHNPFGSDNPKEPFACDCRKLVPVRYALSSELYPPITGGILGIANAEEIYWVI